MSMPLGLPWAWRSQAMDTSRSAASSVGVRKASAMARAMARESAALDPRPAPSGILDFTWTESGTEQSRSKASLEVQKQNPRCPGSGSCSGVSESTTSRVMVLTGTARAGAPCTTKCSPMRMALAGADPMYISRGFHGARPARRRRSRSRCGPAAEAPRSGVPAPLRRRRGPVQSCAHATACGRAECPPWPAR